MSDKPVEVSVEYDWTEMSELDKDREIFAVAGREPHSCGTDVGNRVSTRDMQFEFPGKEEARAAIARLRGIAGVRARFMR
jgi:hypothetical protein